MAFKYSTKVWLIIETQYLSISKSNKGLCTGCPTNFEKPNYFEIQSRYEDSEGTLWSSSWFYLLGHRFDQEFRRICSQWIFKVLSQAWDPQKEASKKIFKCVSSACVSSGNFLTKLPKLLMTHHLGLCPKKIFSMNFQISDFFLEFPMLWP